VSLHPRARPGSRCVRWVGPIAPRRAAPCGRAFVRSPCRAATDRWAAAHAARSTPLCHAPPGRIPSTPTHSRTWHHRGLASQAHRSPPRPQHRAPSWRPPPEKGQQPPAPALLSRSPTGLLEGQPPRLARLLSHPLPHRCFTAGASCLRRAARHFPRGRPWTPWSSRPPTSCRPWRGVPPRPPRPRPRRPSRRRRRRPAAPSRRGPGSPCAWPGRRSCPWRPGRAA